MQYECYFCHTKAIERIINRFNPDEAKTDELVNAINRILSDWKTQTNPQVAAQVQRSARNILNNGDIYIQEKNHANKTLLSVYDKWSDIVSDSNNSFGVAAKLAVAGNIIDYGANTAPDDIDGTIKKLLNRELRVDDSTNLESAIKSAKSVLYLGDNCGEVVFDKLFISVMNHPNVTYAVRGGAVINDVTYNDALMVGMHDVCDIISNGYDAPSTILDCCSNEFTDAFNEADVVISKGQGNLEGLIDSDKKNLFFMLMAKCNPIAKLLGVERGDMLITKGERINGIL